MPQGRQDFPRADPPQRRRTQPSHVRVFMPHHRQERLDRAPIADPFQRAAEETFDLRVFPVQRSKHRRHARRAQRDQVVLDVLVLPRTNGLGQADSNQTTGDHVHLTPAQFREQAPDPPPGRRRVPPPRESPRGEGEDGEDDEQRPSALCHRRIPSRTRLSPSRRLGARGARAPSPLCVHGCAQGLYRQWTEA